MVGGWTDIVVHYYNSSTQRRQAGKESLKLAGLLGETLSIKTKTKQQQQ